MLVINTNFRAGPNTACVCLQLLQERTKDRKTCPVGEPGNSDTGRAESPRNKLFSNFSYSKKVGKYYSQPKLFRKYFQI